MLLTIVCTVTTAAQSQRQATLLKQRSFRHSVPAGNYSGVTYLGGNRYAVCNDKSATAGFHLFTIDIDSLTGRILHVSHDDFRSAGGDNRDEEGIAYFVPDGTLFVSGESDGEVVEYAMSGEPTGRRLSVPRELVSRALPNRSLEALSYNFSTASFWTCTESPLSDETALRLMRFDNTLHAGGQWLYGMDQPVAARRKGRSVHGVAALSALDDGRLLVLEREVFAARRGIGSFVHCCIYSVLPTEANAGQLLDKQLLAEFTTRINLVRRSLANYEGMCVGPRLADGRRVLVMVCDSQNQYRGLLRDWFKTIVLD